MTHYLWTSKFPLKRLPCHRLVISSVSFSVGSPDTVAKTIRVRPFLDIFRSSSGLEESTLEKSMGGGDLLCSGRSPSSMSSSSCSPPPKEKMATVSWQASSVLIRKQCSEEMGQHLNKTCAENQSLLPACRLTSVQDELTGAVSSRLQGRHPVVALCNYILSHL